MLQSTQGAGSKLQVTGCKDKESTKGKLQLVEARSCKSEGNPIKEKNTRNVELFAIAKYVTA